MARVCSNCKSSEFKQIGAIRSQLLQKNSSTTFGIGTMSGGIGLGGAKSSGTSAPQLIKNIDARNPTKPSILKIIILFILLGIFFGVGNQQSELESSGPGPALYYIISLILIIPIILSIRGRIKYKSKLELYNRTWYCFSCGQFRVIKN